MNQEEKLKAALFSADPQKKLQAAKWIMQNPSKGAGRLLVDAFKKENDAEIKAKLQVAIQKVKLALEGNPAAIKSPVSSPAEENQKNNPAPAKTRESVPEPSAATPSAAQPSAPPAAQPAAPPPEPERILACLKAKDEDMKRKGFIWLIQTKDRNLVTEVLKLAFERADETYNSEILNALIQIDNPEYIAEMTGLILCLNREQLETILSHTFKHELQDLSFRRLARLEESDMPRAIEILTEFLPGHPGVAFFIEKLQNRIKSAARNVQIDPDLLPKTKGQQKTEAADKSEEKRKSLAKVMMLRAKLEEASAKEDIITLLGQLIELKDPGAQETILQKIAVSKDLEVIVAGLRALSSTSESALPSLANYLGHENQEVRLAAAQSVNELASGKEARILEKMLTDTDPECKAQAIIGMYKTDEKACFLPLSSLANAKDEKAQMSAMTVVFHLQIDSHLIHLYKFFHSQSAELQTRARQILESWTGDKEAAGFILNKPSEDFTAFFKAHNEKKKLKTTAEPKSEAGTEASETSEEKTNPAKKGPKLPAFLEGLLRRFRKS